MQTTTPWFWVGEPIWEAAAKAGRYATTTLWPGSEVNRSGWTCVPAVCAQFGRGPVNGSSPHADLVSHTLSYLRQPSPPDFMTLYFSDVDHAGHTFGADAPGIVEAVGAVNAALDSLLSGMAALGVLDTTHVLLVSDHGMAPLCAEKVRAAHFAPLRTCCSLSCSGSSLTHPPANHPG